MDARRGDKDPGDQIRREPLTVIHGRDPVADRFTHFPGADQTAKGNGDTDGRQAVFDVERREDDDTIWCRVFSPW